MTCRPARWRGATVLAAPDIAVRARLLARIATSSHLSRFRLLSASVGRHLPKKSVPQAVPKRWAKRSCQVGTLARAEPGRHTWVSARGERAHTDNRGHDRRHRAGGVRRWTGGHAEPT